MICTFDNLFLFPQCLIFYHQGVISTEFKATTRPQFANSQEALTLHDLRLGEIARESFADGLARLPTKRLSKIAEVGDMLQDENHKARAEK